MIKSLRFKPTHFMVVDEDAGEYVKIEDYNFLLESLARLNKVLGLCSESLEENNREIARLTLLLQMRTTELEAARVKCVISELDREDAVGVTALQYVYQYRSKAPNMSSFPDWLTCNKPVYDRFKNYNYNDGWQYQTRKLIILGE